LKYTDFGPTFLSEKLSENHNIKVSRETLSKCLMAENIWSAKCRSKARIQIDGSPNDWIEGRRDKCCLIVLIDDATGKIMHLRFEEAETTDGYFRAMLSYVKQYGLPIALYSDKHSIFRVNMPERFMKEKHNLNERWMPWV